MLLLGILNGEKRENILKPYYVAKGIEPAYWERYPLPSQVQKVQMFISIKKGG